jgi:ABC-type lipoprotein release transport system permease subunit
LASTLTAISMALGVGLIVAVMVVSHVVENYFRTGAGLGYNLVIGKKGSSLQLVLNTVYYLDRPIENIPWSYYTEFLPAAKRTDQENGKFAAWVDKAVPVNLGDYFSGFRVVGTTAEMFDSLELTPGEAFEFTAGENFPADDFFTGVIGATVAEQTGLGVGDTFSPSHAADDGHIHEEEFRITGILKRTGSPIDRALYVNIEGFYLLAGHALEESPTKPGLSSAQKKHDHKHDHAHDHDHDEGKTGEAKKSDANHDHNHDHGPSDGKSSAAVQPATAEDHDQIHQSDVKSDEKSQSHDHEHDHADDSKSSATKKAERHVEHDHKHDGETHAHDESKPHSYEKADHKHDHAAHEHDHVHAATHDDDHGHKHAHSHDHDHGHSHHHHHHTPLPEEQREVTAILVLTKSVAGLPPEATASSIIKPINKDVVAQAVQPIYVITQFLASFLSPLRALLLGLTVLIVVISGISILVSIYNSMAERRHEIAVMRALGAGRTTVMQIMLLESVLLALAGGLVGWLVSHAILGVMTPWLTQWTGATFQPFHFTRAELWLIPGIIVLASLVGFLPAWSAYRTDVAKALTANP